MWTIMGIYSRERNNEPLLKNINCIITTSNEIKFLQGGKILISKNIFPIILMICLWTEGFQAKPDLTQSSFSLTTYVKNVLKDSVHTFQRDEVLVFLIRFTDFECSTCLNSLLVFCDSVKTNVQRYGDKNILILFMKRSDDSLVRVPSMKVWAAENNLNYPLYLVPEDFFVTNGIFYSSIAVIDLANDMEIKRELPLSVEAEKKILDTAFHRLK